MKIETQIARILSSDASSALKVSKLQTLALRCIASSPVQKHVVATYKALASGQTYAGSPADFYS